VFQKGDAKMPDPIVNTQPSLVLPQYIEQFGIFPPRDTDGGVGTHISTIHTFAGVAPFESRSGLLYANGALVPIAQNTALFSLLGINYGGNGISNFALPNLVGRTSNYFGQGPGLDLYDLGQNFGQSTAPLTNVQLPPSEGGSSQPIDNHQPTLTLNFFINAFGIFPSRSGGGTATNIIGQVFQAAENFPVGIPCDGRLLPISEYEALFVIIGTTYGGDGLTTFAVPDLRGRTIIGSGNGYDVGETVGTEDITIGQANLPVNMGGNGTPVNNQQPGLVLNTMVALNGIFQGFDDMTPAIGEIIYFCRTICSERLCSGAGAVVADQPKPGFVLANRHDLWRQWHDEFCPAQSCRACDCRHRQSGRQSCGWNRFGQRNNRDHFGDDFELEFERHP
jgi:microcystin-dependent protein